MAENRNTFNDQDAEELLQLIGGSGAPANGSGVPSIGEGRDRYIAQTPGGGIAARSGSTISSADCTIYNGLGGTLTSCGVTLPVYNLSTTAVGASKYIVCVMAGGVLVAVWEDC